MSMALFRGVGRTHALQLQTFQDVWPRCLEVLVCVAWNPFLENILVLCIVTLYVVLCAFKHVTLRGVTGFTRFYETLNQ
jgi:hypothetical protein